MTALPGSLDYLYYNGVLDHIPYEAYEMPPVAANYGNTMNGTEYLNYAKQGMLYNTGAQNDAFVKGANYNTTNEKSFFEKSMGISDDIGRTPSFTRDVLDNEGSGQNLDPEVMALDAEGKSIRQTLTNGAKSATQAISNAPTFVKGLISGGIIVGTLYCLLKGKKTPAKTTGGNSFWSTFKNKFKRKKI
jgi:hypothetical protein